ncbi:MAG: hypothetical protein HYR73_08495 [Candidatus Eisenbacteria bacterium]|nr:hypothetical protein [Candidatus Eisenbacteria bacterium]
MLRVRGHDALSLLHNLSTQSLLDLAPGEARMTLFCDFRGRLLHRVAVAHTSDGTLWLVRPDAPGESLAAHVDHHVFREDVQIEDVSGAWHVSESFGEGGAATGHVIEHDGEFQIAPRTGYRIQIARIPASAVPRDPTAATRDDRDRSRTAGEPGRLRLGWPRDGFEIRDTFNPFEVNLGADVHLGKGCFTGQEALMRLVTYRSVRRRLALIEGAGETEASRELMNDRGERVGLLTSVAPREDAGAPPGEPPGHPWIALAVLALDFAKPGRVLRSGLDGRASVTRVFPFESPLGRTFQL